MRCPCFNNSVRPNLRSAQKPTLSSEIAPQAAAAMITPIQPVLRSSVDGGADKNRLARHREARAFQHHDYENGSITVVGDEGLKQGNIEEGRGAYHHSTLKDTIGKLRRPYAGAGRSRLDLLTLSSSHLGSNLTLTRRESYVRFATTTAMSGGCHEEDRLRQSIPSNADSKTMESILSSSAA